MDFVVQWDHRVKLKESNKKNKYQYIARESLKSVKHESDYDSNCHCCSLYSH